MSTTEPIPARGWHVRIECDDGTVFRPEVTDAEWTPSAGSKPEVSLVTRPDETWLDERVDGATATVWSDGSRLPLDRVEDITHSPAETTLTITGGEQLSRRVQADVQNSPSHELAEQLINEHTDYVADVDTPETDPLVDLVQQDAETQEQFEAFFERPLGDTTPATITSTSLERAQTAFWRTESGAGGGFSGTYISLDDDDAEGEEAANLNSDSHSISVNSFELASDLPAEYLGVAIRGYEGTNTTGETILRGEIDGDTVYNEIVVDFPSILSGYGWRENEGVASEMLEAGSHIMSLYLIDPPEASDPGDGMVFDSVVFYDTRVVTFPDEFDNDPTGTDNVLDSPGPYSGSVDVESETVVTPLGADAATISVDINDTTNDQALGISTDAGETFQTTSNTDEATFNFAESEGSLTALLRLSGYGTQSQTPTQDTNPQIVDSYTLTADISNIPRVINDFYDDDLEDVLADLAGDHSIWELRWDRDAETMRVIWSRPGQRESGDVLDPSDYQVRRNGRDIIEAATVVGARSTQSDEAITVTDLGEAHTLERERIVPGTEEVRGDDGQRYTAAIDYHLAALTGEITPLQAGDIDAGEELTLTYDWKVTGRFESDDWGGDAATDAKATIPQLSSESACEQAAAQLVQRASEPRVEARVDLATIDPDQSVVEALDIAGLPEHMRTWEPREIDTDRERPSLVLGAGRTLEEEIDLIRQGIGRLEDRA